MRAKFIKRLTGALLVAAFTAACSDQGPEATGDVDVTMQQTDAILAQVVSGWSASIVSGEASMVLVDPDTVETLVLRVTTIEFLPQGRDEADAQGRNLLSPIANAQSPTRLHDRKN